MYNMMTALNTAVVYFKVKRMNPKSSYHKEKQVTKKLCLYEMKGVH